MAEELLGRRCIIIPTQSMHLECIENYRKTHNGEVPDCSECPYNERVFDIIGRSVSRWGVEKVFLVDEENIAVQACYSTADADTANREIGQLKN